MDESGRETEVASLMRSGPETDALEESVALAALERQLFRRRSPAPVLDRYVLLERIGTGGQGVVFAAYDPDLDRRVAIKLLRIREDAAVPRVSILLDEAKLMAQVSHANVLTIHDVGTYTRRDLGLVEGTQDNLEIPEAGLFLVMELMEGGSLRDVLRRRPGFREVMPLLMAAGRGIAAAHQRGIVHRDFKPANVLVSARGEVRVSDFGLARPLTAEADGGAGTPAYMAPEQLRGGVADERTDQYAFALTSYVAIYGERPFADGERRVLQSVEAHRRSRVPRAVYTVLRRALQSEPARRYPDMTSLLRALERAQVDRLRRIAVVALLGVGAGGVAWWTVPVAQSDPCDTAGGAIDETWNEASRTRLRAAFEATGASFADRSSQTVRSALDDYAEDWRRAARGACEDTHVRHVESEAQLDRRTDCLERRRLELTDALGVMESADGAVLANAVEVVYGLGSIAACHDPRVDASPRSVPQDSTFREALRRISSDLGRARLLEVSGRYAEAMALAQSARDRAQLRRDPALEAAAHVRMGSIAGRRGQYDEARGLLLRGIQLAEAARDDELAVDGWTRLLWITGVEMQVEEGDTWAGFARAALERLGEDPMREAQLVHNLGGLDYRRGRFEQSLAHYQQALDAQEALLSADDPRIARTLNHIANVLIEIGENERALQYALRSLKIRREVLGEQHPLVAASLNNCASANLRLRRLDAARANVEEALAIAAGTGLPEEAVARRLVQWIEDVR